MVKETNLKLQQANKNFRRFTVITLVLLVAITVAGFKLSPRFAASQGILNYLAFKNARVLAATHDLDLAENLQGLYRCYHFIDQVGRDGLKFDFKLKKGISSTRNAIKLLEYLRYPEEIIEQANTIAGQYSHGLKDLEE